MPFNDNQLFYAALYLTESLPGGEAFTDEICRKHGKPYLPMNASPTAAFHSGRFWPLPPKLDMPVEEMNRARMLLQEGVTREQCEAFFDGCLQGLKTQQNDNEKLRYTAQDSKYIDLSVDDNLLDVQKRLWPAVVAATEASGLPIQILPEAMKAYLHDNGLLLTYTASKEWANVAYPGKPVVDYLYLPDLSPKDLAYCPKVRRETLFRIVSLSPGQKFFQVESYPERMRKECVAKREGEQLSLAHYDTPVPLADLTDEEIINGGSRITDSRHCRPGELSAGGVSYDPERGELLEPVGTTGVFRGLSAPLACMDVKEETAFRRGASFSVARPGDKIIVDGGVRVIAREGIESGKVRFVPAEKASGPQLKNNKLQ